MARRIIAFIRGPQFRELFIYGIVGALTTAVCMATYWAASRALMLLLHAPEVTGPISIGATILSHIIAILFAFVTNKRFVFHSPNWRGRAFWREFIMFAGARLAALGLDVAFMWFALSALGMNDMLAKLIVQFIIIAFNYIISKFWIFKGRE